MRFSALLRSCLPLLVLTVPYLAESALITNSAMPLSYRLTVNPIIAYDDAGANPATFLGNSSQESAIKGFVDDVWAQAGIDVEWLTPQMIDSTEVLNGSGGANGNDPRPTTDLSGDSSGEDHETIADDAGVTIRGTALNIYFVDVAAGFSPLSDNTVAGLAELGGDDISVYVGVNLTGFTAGQEAVGSLLAHEIGHNLGLPHLIEAENLMQAAGEPNQGERLSQAQIDSVTLSGTSRGLLVAIPEPSAGLALFVLGSLALLRRERRKVPTGMVE